MPLRRAALAAALLFPLAAQTPKKPDPAVIARGKKAFQSNCGFCHAEDATGDRGPDLIRSASLSHDKSGDLLTPLIRTGRPDKGMPGFNALTAIQIADIVVFLHSRAADALHSNSVSNDYPLKKLLTGDASRGRTAFESALGCSTCHSPSGDLHGIAGKYRPIELQQRFLYPANAATRNAKIKLPSGEIVQGTVAHDDEFEIAVTDASGQYRSFSRAAGEVEITDPLAAHRALMTKYTDQNVHDLFAYLETLK